MMGGRVLQVGPRIIPVLWHFLLLGLGVDRLDRGRAGLGQALCGLGGFHLPYFMVSRSVRW